MAMMQSITFGGVNSADYGIYIGGEGVFNAPKREVEMIEIPGRNGAFALDKGRFENITVEYTAINHEPDLSTFSANLDAFRNALSAQKGYQRLTDTFHPDEYRMATLRDGLEIEPIEYNTASKFKIKFDCKPQRFLMGGEAPITVENGGTILNPTLFDASPLLEVEGHGDITIGGHVISVSNDPIGYIELMEPTHKENISSGVVVSKSFNPAYLSNGDTITVQPITFTLTFKDSQNRFGNVTASDSGGMSGTTTISDKTAGSFVATVAIDQVTLTAGTNATRNHTISITIYLSDSTTKHASYTATVYYNAATGRIQMAIVPGTNTEWRASKAVADTKGISAMSTASPLGTPTYIDCDLGEAYKIEDDTFVSLNRYIDLGSQLPTLEAGGNEITYTYAITSLKVTPRWWKV